MTQPLSPFFAPKGVAIIGASSNPGKLSYGIFRNLTMYGYKGRVYPVNPKAKEILGLPCYRDVDSVPDPVDLGVIVLPAESVPETLEACGKRGIRSVTIISGGFKEVGVSGQKLEEECLRIALRFGMRLVGPNCVGTMDLHSGLNTTFIAGVPDKGSIGFLSQSGAVCGGIVDYVRGKQVGFSNFVSLGNEADVTETDMIEYLAEDPNTRVITAYVEMIRDGRRFLEVASRVSKIKPIVILKAGRTNAGAKAVSSHTGSIAGAYTAYQAAFKQAGVIEVENVVELFDIANALACQPLPKGNRTVIVTNSGGPAALASDSLAANGLQLAQLSEETQQFLRGRLNPSAQVGNPVDMLGGAEPADYQMALERVSQDPEVDLILPILVPQALINPVEVAKVVVDSVRNGQKTVLTCFMGDQMVVEARKLLHGNGFPMFVFPESIGRTFGLMGWYREWLDKNRGKVEGIITQSGYQGKLRKNIKPGMVLGELDTRPLLEAYGIKVVPGELARTPEEAVKIAHRLAGPVVLKIVSAEILHKSDAGGIRIGVEGDQEVKSSYQDLLREVTHNRPDATLDGILVESLAPKGQEVIVGMKRDANFGPVLMFGLGGIYVELFADVAFRIAPIDRGVALEMIQETKAYKLLGGYRGGVSSDIEALLDCIQHLGELAMDNPQIAEVEINPLRVLPAGQGVIALDGRVIMGE
jgi:acetate---CoA ligase (ADP-forming)